MDTRVSGVADDDEHGKICVHDAVIIAFVLEYLIYQQRRFALPLPTVLHFGDNRRFFGAPQRKEMVLVLAQKHT